MRWSWGPSAGRCMARGVEWVIGEGLLRLKARHQAGVCGLMPRVSIAALAAEAGMARTSLRDVFLKMGDAEVMHLAPGEERI